MQRIPEDLWEILTKTIIPALISVSVGIAVKMKKSKITIWNALGSYVIGIGFAYIFGFAIHENFQSGWGTVMVAAVAITGEKIGYWLIFQLEVDGLGNDVVEWFRRKLK